jgi:hypothetical protein
VLHTTPVPYQECTLAEVEESCAGIRILSSKYFASDEMQMYELSAAGGFVLLCCVMWQCGHERRHDDGWCECSRNPRIIEVQSVVAGMMEVGTETLFSETRQLAHAQ